MVRRNRIPLLLATVVCVFTSAAYAQTPLRGSSVAASVPACKSGYYKNAYGQCVQSPSTAPAGATAKCRDGTYSYSQHASGTCSYHGGVAVWIHHP